MDGEDRPSENEVDSQFETLRPLAAGEDGEPLFRGTHQYGGVTVERTYHVDDGVLMVETAYLKDEATLAAIDECWLLDGDGHVRHTSADLATFCRGHHFEDPAADVRFCLDGSTTAVRDPLPDPDVTSTFQPATTVTVEDGAALRYEGIHRAGEARVARAFFVSESSERIRVRTTYYWAGERLGSLEETQVLIDGGEFVAATGEPIDAFCRRTHLVDPEADVRFCARLGAGVPAEPPEQP
jgi:hypothetical protein